MLGLMGLMFLSVDPEIQYTVDEVMDSPESYDSGELNVRGIVQEQSLDSSSNTFILAGEELLFIIPPWSHDVFKSKDLPSVL